jgi:hypothetical protein
MGIQAGRLCVGESTRGDLGCPTTAPSLTTAGDVSVTGNLSAQKFIGDGSALTGVVASTSDRIVSGTTSMVADGATGYISLTQSTGNTGWFDPLTGLVTLGVSSTGVVSATKAYLSGGRLELGLSQIIYSDSSGGNGVVIGAPNNSTMKVYSGAGGASTRNIKLSAVVPFGWAGTTPDGVYDTVFSRLRAGVVGLGTAANGTDATLKAGYIGLGISTTDTLSQTLHVSGTALVTSWTAINFPPGTRVTPTAPLEVSGTVSATRFVGDGSGLTGVVASTGDRIVSSTTSMIAVSDTGYISLTQAGTNTAWFDPYRGLITLGVSATGGISATNGYFNGYAGIGMAPQASYRLSVGGTSAFSGNMFINGNVHLPVNNKGIYWGTGSFLSSITAAGGSGNDYLALAISNTEALRIVSTWYVGIGTATPATALELYDTTSPTTLTLTGYGVGNVSTYPGISFYSIGSGGYARSYASRIEAKAYPTNSALTFKTLNSSGTLTGWTVQGDGSLVQGLNRWAAIGNTGITFDGNSGAAYKYVEVARQGGSGIKGQSLHLRGGQSHSVANGVNDVGGNILVYGGAPSNGGAYGDVVLAHNGANAVGKVGIGISSPTTTLQVSGTALTTSWTGINFSSAANVTPTAPLEVSGTISATRFVGDGSGLTGLNASNVSITTGASGSLVFRDGYGSLMASPGLSVSSTTGSVGIGAGAPANMGNSGLYTAGNVYAAGNLTVVNGPVLDISAGIPTIRSFNSGTNSTGLALASDYRAPEAMRIVSTGYVGIGTNAPTTSLEVSGTVSATAVSTFTLGNIAGSSISVTTNYLRFKPRTGSALAFGRYGDPLWMADTWYDTTNSSTEVFRIGTSNLVPAWLIRSRNGYPIIFNTTSGSVIPGVAIGGWGDGGNFPSTLSATLFVKGSQITTSWTSIGFNDSSRTATAPLEVSGTISATRFVGDGSGLTGVIATTDTITSGTTKVTANQSTGISATADVAVSGTLQVAGSNTPGGGCTSAADNGKLKWENGTLFLCK